MTDEADEEVVSGATAADVVPQYIARPFPPPAHARAFAAAPATRFTLVRGTHASARRHAVTQSLSQTCGSVHRDYGVGAHTAFGSALPAALGAPAHRIDAARHARVVAAVNARLAQAERIGVATLAWHVAECVSCFAARLCRPHAYDAALRDVWRALERENREYYEPRGVQWQNPALNGLTELELLCRVEPTVGAAGARACAARLPRVSHPPVLLCCSLQCSFRRRSRGDRCAALLAESDGAESAVDGSASSADEAAALLPAASQRTAAAAASVAESGNASRKRAKHRKKTRRKDAE